MEAAASAPGPFVGRAEAVDQLRRRQDEAWAGRGGLTLVLGEVGVGKSSLLRLVAEECAERGMNLLRAAPTGPGAAPLQLIRDILASGPADRSARGTGGPSGDSLAAVVAATPVPAGLAGFAGAPEGWPGRGLPTEASPLGGEGRGGEPPGARESPAFHPLIEEFRRLVERGPTVILVEDLEGADDASFEFLLHALPELSRHPLWFVASSLPLSQVPEARRAWLERLRREVGLEEVVVRPFTPQELPEFLRTIAPGREVEGGEIAKWHAQSGGNPLFLERLLRGDGPPPRPPVPAPDAGAEARRLLASLPPAEAKLLGACAVLGHRFPFSLLWAASGEDEERVAELVEGLVVRGVLREGIDEELEFLREDVRGRVYASLTAAHRRLLHAKAGEALERTGTADAATVYTLAHHYYLGRIDDRSALYNRLAGELAARAGSPTVARLHLERALEAHRRSRPDDAVGELELLLDLVLQLDRLGELAEADRLLSEAFRRQPLFDAASPGQRALARLYRARLLTDQGRWGEADRLTEELLGSADVQFGPRTMLAAHRLRGELLYFRGDYAEALRHHEIAQRLARQLHDDREIALETVRIANALAMMPGRAEEAIASYRVAAEALIGLGDLGEAAHAELFLGVVESQQGRTLDGLRELDKALTLAEEGHDPRRTGWARFNLADLERERGHLEAARRHNARALTILTGVGDQFGLLQVHLIEGKIRLAEGHAAPAEVELLEAYRLARDLQAPADEVEALLWLVLASLALGDLARAKARVAEAERIGLRRRPELEREWAEARRRVAEAGGA